MRVTSQVMAQPDPNLAERVIASLADGTPLVTRKRIGQGQVVLFHVTANAEWSTLPLSGLFVQMLERLSVSTQPTNLKPEELLGTVWSADATMDAFGAIREVTDLAGVPGARVAEGRPAPDMPPGIYSSEGQRIAVNVIGSTMSILPVAWPESIKIQELVALRETALKGWFIAAAIVLLMLGRSRFALADRTANLGFTRYGRRTWSCSVQRGSG